MCVFKQSSVCVSLHALSLSYQCHFTSMVELASQAAETMGHRRVHSYQQRLLAQYNSGVGTRGIQLSRVSYPAIRTRTGKLEEVTRFSS
jgi:hypothetical protein